MTLDLPSIALLSIPYAASCLAAFVAGRNTKQKEMVRLLNMRIDMQGSEIADLRAENKKLQDGHANCQRQMQDLREQLLVVTTAYMKVKLTEGA
jgi:hypothetical protein